eukprot:TRINITY_DN23044_c0_g1_i1.p1 TRINITY_DN23044_c0_g1~~TRINITY_DN23044_c0_g1_i1.p1  ORF type:complete len:204 (+),score=43.14 TRINITY_DN23044_c0_g1_i1:185-796(+)
MEDLVFQLKFSSRQFEKESRRTEKSVATSKAKVKAAIEKGNIEVARVHADTAIRQKNQALTYLKLSARLEAVSARVDSACKMRRVTEQMRGVVKGMDKVLDSMNPGKIAEVMAQFEKQFDDVDVTTSYMDHAMDTTTATAAPRDEVDALLLAIADEHQLDAAGELRATTAGKSSLKTEGAAAQKEDTGKSKELEELEARFAAL